MCNIGIKIPILSHSCFAKNAISPKYYVTANVLFAAGRFSFSLPLLLPPLPFPSLKKKKNWKKMKQSLFLLPFFPFLLLPLFLIKKKNGRSHKARVFKGLKEKRKEEEEPLFSGFGEKCPSSSYFLARKRPWKKRGRKLLFCKV